MTVAVSDSCVHMPSSSSDYWKDVLGSPRHLLAPMVDASERAWRLLSRRYGAHVCFTPMLHASIFVRDHTYRKENVMHACKDDRPLIVQFCANDPDALLEASKLAIPFCEGIDLNLGCPQAIARKGKYGAYLQDDWQLIEDMVTKVAQSGIPISCKIRVFDDVEKTIRYARMLENAGCKFLTVHGRTREQKGPLTGLADWSQIAAVKRAVSIPVVSNGNIQYFRDVERCFKETGVDAVMIAEGSLHNPALFADQQPPAWKVGAEYLELVDKYPCPISYVRGHLFKLYHPCMLVHKDLRGIIARAVTSEDFKFVTRELEKKLGTSHEDYLKKINEGIKTDGCTIPYWICQPYERPPPITELNPRNRSSDEGGVETENGVENVRDIMSRRKRKRMLKQMEQEKAKQAKAEEKIPPAQTIVKQPRFLHLCDCLNPASERCEFMSCRKCCRLKCLEKTAGCSGHRFRVFPPAIDHVIANCRISGFAVDHVADS